MAIRFVVANGSGPTGRILVNLMEQREMRVNNGAEQGRIMYGVPYDGPLPSLNRNAGRLDKHAQQRRFVERGVRTIEAFTPTDAARLPQARFPMLARKRHHVAGRDIMLALQPEDVNMRVRAGAEFFTPYIPSVTEFRVYVYRRQHLGTYQKVLVRPAEYKKVGRNYANGFAFNLVRTADVPREAVELASSAVEALELDFAAVDILQGKDGHFYVLECNTAPGVEGEGRQVIQALADKFAAWERGGYLARRGTPEAAARVEARRAARPVVRPRQPGVVNRIRPRRSRFDATAGRGR